MSADQQYADHLKRLAAVSCKDGDCKCSPTPYFDESDMSETIYWGDISNGDRVGRDFKAGKEIFPVTLSNGDKRLARWEESEEVIAKQCLRKMAAVL